MKSKALESSSSLPTDSSSSSDECAPLLENAHAKIYRENPFRVTGLAVDATAKTVARHAAKLKQMEELGYPVGGRVAALALEPAATLDDIRLATERLADPEQRFVSEFFWFWPKTFGESETDPAMQALNASNLGKAFELWDADHSSPAAEFTANHNIAVLFHVVALDWTLYHLKADVDIEREDKIRRYWKDSFIRWEKLSSDDQLGEFLKSRLRSLDDPRLTTGFVRRFISSLPIAINKINGDAALNFIEKGKVEWAKTHIQFMHETYRGTEYLSKSIELTLAPMRKRLQKGIERTRITTQKDPKQGGEAAKLLVEEGRRVHWIYGLFYPDDAYQKTELFDDVAAAGLTCAVDYQKATADNKLFVEILSTSLSLVSAPELRERIGKNIETALWNIRSGAIEPLYKKLRAIRDKDGIIKDRLQQYKSIIVPELAQLAESVAANATNGTESCSGAINQQTVDDFCDTLAGALRGLSIEAHNEEDDFETAAEAIKIAVRLARSSELKKQCRNDQQLVDKHLAEFQATQVHVTSGKNKISVTRDGVTYNTQKIPVSDVTGVRFGILRKYTNGIPTSASYEVGFCSTTTAIHIECKRTFGSQAEAKANYEAILNGFYNNIAPKLIARIADSIKKGNPYPIGGHEIRREGIVLPDRHFFKTTSQLVPWSEIRYGLSNGSLNINSTSRGSATIDLRYAWNAVIFEPIIKKVLAR